MPKLPIRTLNGWRAGDREPPAWEQDLILEKLGNPPEDFVPSEIDPEKPQRGRPRKNRR